MRAMMGLQKDRHGTYYARQKVPIRLQEAVARVLDNNKVKQVWLKRSLGTKDLRKANVRAKPVLMEFDRLIARAEGLLKARPVRTSLSDAEIRRMAEYVYAHTLSMHDKYVCEAPEEEADFRRFTELDEGPQEWADAIPEYGLSDGQIADAAEVMPRLISDAEAALARGDIRHAEYKIENALETFHINLDKNCRDYRKLGIEILRAYVKALRAISARLKGEPVETPPMVLPGETGMGSSRSLREALVGWQKERSPSKGVLNEYERAVRLFTELHGDLPIAQIKRTHARTFREALQDLPRHRSAELLDAPLPELAEWGRKHPEAPKVTAATANKPELNMLFASPVFATGKRPAPGRGEAAFWLPLLGLYPGARRGELAALTVKDTLKMEGVFAFTFLEERAAGKRLKTRTSARTVPVHPQLVRLGWLNYVEAIRRDGGEPQQCNAQQEK